jgi:hypothetical protein
MAQVITRLTAARAKIATNINAERRDNGADQASTSSSQSSRKVSFRRKVSYIDNASNHSSEDFVSNDSSASEEDDSNKRKLNAGLIAKGNTNQLRKRLLEWNKSQLQDESRKAGLRAKGNTNQLRKRLLEWNESQSQKDELDTKRSKNTASNEKFFCPICLNVASDVLESSCCGNLYCRECAGTAFKSNKACPICRKTHAGCGIPESWQHSNWIER